MSETHDDLAEWRAERAQARLAALAKRIPARYQDARIDETTEDPKILAWIKATLDAQPTSPINTPTMRGGSLLLLGPTGVGKTHKAFALARHLAEHGGDLMPVTMVTTAADLYARLRPRSGVDSEQVFGTYATAELLLVDDLGAAKSSDWVEEQTYRLINTRYNDQLITVFTSNVPPKELGAMLGERVASRLTEMCTVVVLKGEDRRRAA